MCVDVQDDIPELGRHFFLSLSVGIAGGHDVKRELCKVSADLIFPVGTDLGVLLQKAVQLLMQFHGSLGAESNALVPDKIIVQPEGRDAGEMQDAVFQKASKVW